MKKLPKYLQSFLIVLAVTEIFFAVDYLWFGAISRLYTLRYSLGILGFMLLFDTFKLATTDLGTDFTTTVR